MTIENPNPLPPGGPGDGGENPEDGGGGTNPPD